ncbi:hypothetical protein ACTXT7_017213, partial [Hymenolepis weldensis]
KINDIFSFPSVRLTTLSRLIKGILRALEHSRKCARVTARVASMCNVSAEAFPANQRP